MSALPIREEVIEQLKVLSDEQVAQVLDFIQSVKREPSPYREEGETLDADDDPAIGFFSGPPDLAETSEEVLWKEYGLKKPQDVQDE